MLYKATQRVFGTVHTVHAAHTAHRASPTEANPLSANERVDCSTKTPRATPGDVPRATRESREGDTRAATAVDSTLPRARHWKGPVGGGSGDDGAICIGCALDEASDGRLLRLVFDADVPIDQVCTHGVLNWRDASLADRRCSRRSSDGQLCQNHTDRLNAMFASCASNEIVRAYPTDVPYVDESTGRVLFDPTHYPCVATRALEECAICMSTGSCVHAGYACAHRLCVGCVANAHAMRGAGYRICVANDHCARPTCVPVQDTARRSARRCPYCRAVALDNAEVPEGQYQPTTDLINSLVMATRCIATVRRIRVLEELLSVLELPTLPPGPLITRWTHADETTPSDLVACIPPLEQRCLAMVELCRLCISQSIRGCGLRAIAEHTPQAASTRRGYGLSAQATASRRMLASLFGNARRRGGLRIPEMPIRNAASELPMSVQGDIHRLLQNASA